LARDVVVCDWGDLAKRSLMIDLIAARKEPVQIRWTRWGLERSGHDSLAFCLFIFLD